MRLSVREVTSAENAPPMITPMAMSIMLPSGKGFKFFPKLFHNKTSVSLYRQQGLVYFSSLATAWAAPSR